MLWETARKEAIPDWAYRDVLFILIDYGERAHTIVYGRMSAADRETHFNALIALGHAMHLTGLPASYEEYATQRHQQLVDDYTHSDLTDRLNAAYRKALGPVRYWLLQLLQGCLLPAELQSVTGLQPQPIMAALLRLYCYLPGGGNKLRWLQPLLLPPPYASQLQQLGR